MELKHKSPEVAVTTKGAIGNSNQNNRTYDRRINQEPKHISFFLYRVMDLIINCVALEADHG